MINDAYEKGFNESFGKQGSQVLQDTMRQNQNFDKRIDTYANKILANDPKMDKQQLYERLGQMQGKMLRDQVQVNNDKITYSNLAKKWLFDQQIDAQQEQQRGRQIENLSKSKQAASHQAYHEIQNESQVPHALHVDTQPNEPDYDEPEF